MIVFEPKRRYWLKGEVEHRLPGPVRGPVPGHVLRVGTDATVVAYGPLVPVALAAASAAAKRPQRGSDRHLRSISPIDFDTVTASVRKKPAG